MVGIWVDHPHIGIFDKLYPFTLGTGFLEQHALFTGKCLPVQYRKQPRYRVDRFDFDYSNISVEGEDRLLFEIFQQKSDEWIYEKEHRITLRLEQADVVKVFDLEALSNDRLIANIKNCGAYSEENIGNEVVGTINLRGLDDDYRYAYASALAPLSVNPRNLYLFKLSPSSISSVIVGHRSPITMLEPHPEYPSITGSFDILRTSLDRDHYSIKVPLDD